MDLSGATTEVAAMKKALFEAEHKAALDTAFLRDATLVVSSVTKSRRFVVRITNFIYHSLYESGESLTFVLFKLPPREVELSLRLLQALF